jgi:hypothetical protein
MAVNRRAIMSRWADATRHMQWDDADNLWRELMTERLKPPATNQRYWNDLVRRRMAALERKEQRLAIDDAEWDIRREDVTR